MTDNGSYKPEQITSQMVDVFRDRASSLLQVNDESSFVREKGFYYYLIAKLSKKLRSTLSIDREVVVLFTSFDDQQPRTLSALDHIHNLDKYHGRLEPSVAIVCHQDRSGNQKLRNWGRERGISIIPIYFRNGQLPKNTNLEKEIAYHIYSHDPFDRTGPVSTDDQFYGRREEVLDLARKLQTGTIRSCFGIRKIGKTSILHRALDTLSNHHDCVSIFLDCSQDKIFNLDAGQLLASIAETIRSAENHSNKYLEVEPQKDVYDISDAQEDFVDALSLHSKPIILFMDELDWITPGSPEASHWQRDFNRFWRNLRSVYQRALRNEQHFSLLIAGVSSKWFSVESINGIENAALAFVPEEYVTPLPRGAAVPMIQRMAKTAGLQFTGSSAELVADTCNDIPYWIRKCCSHIHQHIEIEKRPKTLRDEDVLPIIDSFIQSDGSEIGKVALSHLFRVYPELEKYCISTDITVNQIPAKHRRALDLYGIINSYQGNFFRSRIIQEALRIYLEDRAASGAAQEPQYGTKANPAFNFEEYAEEIALIAKRFTAIEKQLRDLVLNFLRMDSLNDKTKKDVRTRIIDRLASQRKTELSRYDSFQMMEALYWKELCSIIDKEWPVFERVFGDKKEFQEHAKILNDRPQAHSKNVDKISVALYRRSFEWFEQRLRV